jgi:flagellar biosynthesis/type III secretory pathway protein FliH
MVESATSWTWDEIPLGPQGPPRDPEVVAEEERARMEVALDEAYMKGLEDGIAQGKTQARHELASALSVANEVVDGVRAMHGEWAATLQETLAAVSVAIARQLVDREIKADPEVMGQLVRQGLAHFPADQTVRIRVSPRDLVAISGADAGESRITGSRNARWVADENIESGSFIIDGPERVLDGRLDKALERIIRSLTDG